MTDLGFLGEGRFDGGTGAVDGDTGSALVVDGRDGEAAHSDAKPFGDVFPAWPYWVSPPQECGDDEVVLFGCQGRAVAV